MIANLTTSSARPASIARVAVAKPAPINPPSSAAPAPCVRECRSTGPNADVFSDNQKISKPTMANVSVTAIASTPSATKKIISRLSVAAPRSGRSGSSIWTPPCTASIAPRFLREMGSRMRSRIWNVFSLRRCVRGTLLGSRLCGGSRILRARTLAMAAVLVCSPRTNRTMARGHCEPVISPLPPPLAMSHHRRTVRS